MVEPGKRPERGGIGRRKRGFRVRGVHLGLDQGAGEAEELAASGLIEVLVGDGLGLGGIGLWDREGPVNRPH